MIMFVKYEMTDIVKSCRRMFKARFSGSANRLVMVPLRAVGGLQQWRAAGRTPSPMGDYARIVSAAARVAGIYVRLAAACLIDLVQFRVGGDPVGGVPRAVGHGGPLGVGGDAEEVAGGRDHVGQGCLYAGADVEDGAW